MKRGLAPFGEVLGFADDPVRPAPAVEGGVDELSKAPRRLAVLGMHGGRGGKIGAALGDQARRRPTLALGGASPETKIAIMR
jgi:hypothetical protein